MIQTIIQISYTYLKEDENLPFFLRWCIINTIYESTDVLWPTLGGVFLQKTIKALVSQITDIIGVDFGIMDESGNVVTCSDEQMTGQTHPLSQKVLSSAENPVFINGLAFQKVYAKNRLEYILYMDGSDQNARQCLQLIALSVNGVRAGYDEKYDKLNFIKNILFSSVLPGEILSKSKELHIQYNSYRVSFLVRAEKSSEVYAYDVISGLFPNKAKDFVIIIDDENIALIKELKSDEDAHEIEKTANIITDTLNSELMIKVNVGIGTVVDSLRDLGRSFAEAKMALLVGRIFEGDKPIMNYNHLGIGRLIYQIPAPLCELFLDEVFKDGSFESLDEETMHTIQKFFENNLNVSETSRQLYVHRNTLVYRLNKIQKITGLDLTRFDDAIIFKVAILVKKYIDKCNSGS